MTVPVVTGPHEITPEWLTAALRAGGTLPGDRRVTDVTSTPLGTGQMGDVVRLAVAYDGPVEAPASYVAKVPATDAASRATGTQMRSYEVEVRFYQELASCLPVRTPRAHFAAVDEAGLFTLVLEDLGPAVPGDQLAGCDPDRAALAVLEATRLHAARWGDTGLEARRWLHRRDPARTEALAAMLPDLYRGFLQRYGDALDDDVRAMGDRFVTSVRTWYGIRPRPWTIVHTDYRLDNLLFGTAEGGPPVAVVDWQTVGVGVGASDVAYFLGGSVPTALRRRHEVDLLRVWHEAMLAAGVTGYGWNRCWEDYRCAVFAGFHMAVLASMVVERTERGDAMFTTMARRHGRHVIDLEAERLLV